MTTSYAASLPRSAVRPSMIRISSFGSAPGSSTPRFTSYMSLAPSTTCSSSSATSTRLTSSWVVIAAALEPLPRPISRQRSGLPLRRTGR